MFNPDIVFTQKMGSIEGTACWRFIVIDDLSEIKESFPFRRKRIIYRYICIYTTMNRGARISTKARSASLPREKTRLIKTTRKKRSADDIKNMVGDDMTRDLRAEMRIRKGTATIFDRLQKMPRELQSEIFSMGHDYRTQHLANPINRADVLMKANSVILRVLLKPQYRTVLNEDVHSMANGALLDEQPYRTTNFIQNPDDRSDIWSRFNNKVFARTYREFVRKTFVEYQQLDDFIRFRVVPLDNTLINTNSPFKNMYDGIIVVHSDEPSHPYGVNGSRVKQILRKYMGGSDGWVTSFVFTIPGVNRFRAIFVNYDMSPSFSE